VQNIFLDCYVNERLARFPASKSALDLVTQSDTYQAYVKPAGFRNSSLENIEEKTC
jgi:hypothetical protein